QHCMSRLARSPVVLALRSFPTRRSSDLSPRRRKNISAAAVSGSRTSPRSHLSRRSPFHRAARRAGRQIVQERASLIRLIAQIERSEEHTSELQSRENLVCRLLLEKKKKQ